MSALPACMSVATKARDGIDPQELELQTAVN